jgi:hypothetical protein
MYTLTVSSSLGGTTNPMSGTYSYAKGQNVPVQATPNQGYYLHYWELDGNNVGNDLSFTVAMDAPHTLTANFEYSTPPPLPEFPLGSVLYVAAIPLLFYLWRKNKKKNLQ